MFPIEKKAKHENQEQPVKLNVGPEYSDFVPDDFKNNPKKYIEENGENIKSGEIEFHEDGRIKEDPAAAKLLPEWHNESGDILRVVSKKVNIHKTYTKTEPSSTRSVDPLLEYKMMRLCKILNLPTASPIGYTIQPDEMYIIMERVNGFTWTKKDYQKLKEKGFTSEDKESIKNQIEILMSKLSKIFEEFGIYRKWKYSDMIFDLDTPNKQVVNITPIDWEWSHIDKEKLTQRITSLAPEIRKQVLEIIQFK